MRSPSHLITVLLATFLSVALFHIGRLNLRANQVHEELNVCAASLHVADKALIETSERLDECEADLKLNGVEVQKAIEKSVLYCRG